MPVHGIAYHSTFIGDRTSHSTWDSTRDAKSHEMTAVKYP
jgi:hypothetical protein